MTGWLEHADEHISQRCTPLLFQKWHSESLSYFITLVFFFLRKKANTVRKSAYAALLKVSAQLFHQSRKNSLDFSSCNCISLSWREKITVNSNKDSRKCAEHGESGSRVTAEASFSDHIFCYGVQIQYGGCQTQQGWLIFPGNYSE